MDILEGLGNPIEVLIIPFLPAFPLVLADQGCFQPIVTAVLQV